jgi:uracil-DNA glycosylase family 4
VDEEIEFVREAILGCDRCELRAQAKAPVPFSGPAPSINGIAIIAEAPGKDEDEAGEPLIGKAGTLLEDEVRRILKVEWGEITKINTASCFPGEIKTPQPEHVAACETNKLAQLDLAAPKWVLLCGKVALHGFRTDMSISEARGRPFVLEDDGPVFYATYHPSAGLRKMDYLKAIRADLERFKRIIDTGDWIAEIEDRCAICADEVCIIDETGIPWCERHLPEHWQEWKRKQDAEVLADAVRMLQESFEGAELVEGAV